MYKVNGDVTTEREIYDSLVWFYSHHYVYSTCKAFAEADLCRLRTNNSIKLNTETIFTYDEEDTE